MTRAARQSTSEQHLREAFVKAMQDDLSKPATLTETAGAVLYDALQSKDFMERAMVILADTATGRGTQRAAQQLIEEAGAHWAWLNAE